MTTEIIYYHSLRINTMNLIIGYFEVTLQNFTDCVVPHLQWTGMYNVYMCGLHACMCVYCTVWHTGDVLRIGLSQINEPSAEWVLSELESEHTHTKHITMYRRMCSFIMYMCVCVCACMYIRLYVWLTA